MNSGTILNIVVVMLLGWFIYTRFAPVKGLKTLKDADFRDEMTRAEHPLLIDVREPSEFSGGSIPGARNIPLSQLRGRLNEIPKDGSLFLYCRSGMRRRLLGKNGYSKLVHLQGGIGAWSGKIVK